MGFAEEPSCPTGDKVVPHPDAITASPPAAPIQYDVNKKRASMEYLAMEVGHRTSCSACPTFRIDRIHRLC